MILPSAMIGSVDCRFCTKKGADYLDHHYIVFPAKSIIICLRGVMNDPSTVNKTAAHLYSCPVRRATTIQQRLLLFERPTMTSCNHSVQPGDWQQPDRCCRRKCACQQDSLEQGCDVPGSARSKIRVMSDARYAALIGRGERVS